MYAWRSAPALPVEWERRDERGRRRDGRDVPTETSVARDVFHAPGKKKSVRVSRWTSREQTRFSLSAKSNNVNVRQR